MKKIYFLLLAISMFAFSANAQNLTNAEYFFDTDPGFNNGIPISIPLNDSITVTNLPISINGLPLGYHWLYLRVKDSIGNWSFHKSIRYYIYDSSPITPINDSIYLVQAEYFVDAAPSPGNGTLINLPHQDTINYLSPFVGFPIDTNCHTLSLMAKDNLGNWSHPKYGINAPIAQFDYYVSGYDAILVNNSYNHKTTHWNFDDGDTSDQFSPVHHYDSAGVYNICLTESNNCQQTPSTICKTVIIKGVNSITPNYGGNGGHVSCYIQGGGLTQNAIIKLFKTGSNEITAIDSLSSLINPELFLATFDLAGTDIGVYNLSVQIPNDTTLFLDSSFNVQSSIVGEIEVEFIIPPLVRVNRFFPIQIKYRNNSNNNMALPYFAFLSLNDIRIGYSKEQIANNYQALPLFLVNEEGNEALLNGSSMNITNASILSPGITNTITLWGKASAISGITSKFALYDVNKMNEGNNGTNPTPTWTPDMCTGVPDLGFTLPCQNHDDCYGTCGSPKVLCDFGFLAEMIKSCTNSPLYPFDFPTCVATAYAYFFGVVFYGPFFYSQAQLNCTPPPPPPTQQFFPFNLPCLEGAFCGGNSTVSSFDPNIKLGGKIFENSLFHNSIKALNYSVHFENVDTATAPAQTVIITDTLDNQNLNLSTLQLTSFGFADTIISIPPGKKSYTTDIDLQPNLPLIARVTAYLNDSTHVLTAKYESLDPLTMKPTEDALLGFLLPNDSTGRGEGFISYSIKANDSIATGTIINNMATIYFDENPPINTPIWTNIIDDLKPQSQVDSLTTNGIDSIFVHWSGVDNGPANVYAYNVYYNKNGGAWTLWKYNTTLLNDIFVGEKDTTYGFYSVAIDSATNVEGAPSVADKTITISTPLPIVIKNFFLNEYNCSTFLSWTTSHESNSSHIDLYRTSTNASGFQKIATVQSAGQSSQEKMYSYIDKDVKENTTYEYQLQFVDIDGRISKSDSKIITLDCSNSNNSIHVFPNPAKNELNVLYVTESNNSEIKIAIYDLTGRNIISKTQSLNNGGNLITLDVSKLSNGIYFLHYKDIDSMESGSVKFEKR